MLPAQVKADLNGQAQARMYVDACVAPVKSFTLRRERRIADETA